MPSSKKFAMLASEVNIDHITFSDKVHVNTNNNGRTIYTSYSDTSYNGLVVETPWMKLPYGVSVWANDGNGPDRHSVNMSFASDYSKSEEISDFKEFIEKLDDHFINEFHKNSAKWKLKSYNNVDVVRELYTNMIKLSRDKDGSTDKYPPTFKMNLPQRDGIYTFNCVDTRNNHFLLNKANSVGAHVKVIMKCVGMWLAGGKFGCTWRLMNMMIIPKENVSNYNFRLNNVPVSDDDDDVDDKAHKTCSSDVNSDDDQSDDGVDNIDNIEKIDIKDM